MFIDNRDGEEIEYLSIPIEDLEEHGVEIPEFEEVKENGKSFMAVMWADPKNATTKKYEVNDHIVVMGCEGKIKNGKVQCKKKELYVVLHPMSEWIEHHIVNI